MEVQEQFDAIFGENPEQLQAEVDAFEAAQAEKNAVPEETPEEPESAPVAEAPKPEKAADSVPLPVFLDLKNELKELKRELATLRNPPQAEPKQEPIKAPEFKPTVSYEEDPATYLREKSDYQDAVIAYQGQLLGMTQQMTAEQRQAAQYQQNMQQFASAVTASEEQFRAEAADYDDAVEFMRGSRFAEAKEVYDANGLEMTPDVQRQIHAAITNEFASLAQNAMRNQRNPASVLYRLAKARGYAGKQTASDSKVSRLERGVQAAKSSQAMGGAPVQPAERGETDFFKSLQREAGYRR